MLIDSEGFRVNAYLMQYLKQLSPHVRRNLERGARLGRGDRAAAERIRAAARDRLESLLADFPVLVLPTLAASPPLLGARGFALTALTVRRQPGRAARVVAAGARGLPTSSRLCRSSAVRRSR